MAITITCSCSKQLRLKDVFAGKRVKCPVCGKGLSVPAPAATAPPAAASPAPEEAAFDFASLAAETPPAPAANGKATLPETAPVPTSPEATAHPPVRRATGRLAAVVGGFVLLVAALIGGLIWLLNQGDDNGGPGGGRSGDSGQFAQQGNKDNKLTLEEKQAQVERSRLQNQSDGGSAQGKQKVDAEAERKKAEEARKSRRAAEAKQKQDQEARKAEEKRLAEARKRADLQKLIQDAQAALTTKQYDRSVKLFGQASKLAPENAEVKGGLAKSRQELNRWQEEQRQAQFTKLVATGQQNLTTKAYDQAVADLSAALKLKPEDTAVARALKEAQAGQDKLRREKQKLDQEVEKIVARGRRALKFRDFTGAGKAFDSAAKLAPNHPSVLQAKLDLDRAQKLVVAEAEARKRQQEERKLQARRDKAEAEALVKKGRAALKNRKYAEAEGLFAQANKLAPGDLTTKALLIQAREGVARLTAEARRKQQAEEKLRKHKARKEAATLVEKGRKALAGKRYAEAVTDLSRANQLVPNDKITLGLLSKAQKGLNEIQQTAAAERKKQEELQRAGQVRKLLASTRLALADKKLDEAGRLLAELVKLVPNDPDVSSLIKELAAARKVVADEAARVAAEAARVAAEAARKKRLEEFQSKMKAGRTTLAARRYDNAIKLFSEALRLVQDDKDSTDRVAEANKAIKEAKEARARDAKLKLKISE